MKNRYRLPLRVPIKSYKQTYILACLFAFLSIANHVVGQGFNAKILNEAKTKNATGLNFGPDGRLYVTQQDGLVLAYTVARSDDGTYEVVATEQIKLVQNKQNHDDDGLPSGATDAQNQRQVTGIVATGTAVKPVLYVSSSDPRIGGPSAGDTNLDTNSGTISRLTWIHTEPPSETDFSTLKDTDLWEIVDVVRGLPRSEENHATNGMRITTINNKKMLFIAVGGLTNAGSPSKNFTKITEYALSAAVLSVDLSTIEAMSVKGTGVAKYIYDIPTVDDPTRENIANPDYDASIPGSPQTIDVNDPFGGNDGLNQAKIVPGGPVQVYSPGFRNPYDLVITKDRRMYVTDNGANPGWGGFPENEGTPNVTNNYWNAGEPGTNADSTFNGEYVNNQDHVELITGVGAGTVDDYVAGAHYGGHPNPIRANPTGAGLFTQYGPNNSNEGVFRTSKDDPTYPLPADWPPVPVDMADPREGDFLMPGKEDDAITTWQKNCNAIAEYTASNLDGAYTGNLIAGSSSQGGVLYRLQLNPDGTKKELDQSFSNATKGYVLGIVCQGDADPYAGTIWVATYGGNINILEPADYNGNPVGECDGEYSLDIDGDNDGFSNADEIDNGTDPCSGTNFPDDNDGDYISDLNDPDDDNDGIEDYLDVFQIGATNGLDQEPSFFFDLFNNQFGFYDLGFTGMMTNLNPEDDYINWLDVENPDNPVEDDIYGGATGTITVFMTEGDALGDINNQEKGFQVGVKVDQNTFPFTLQTKMVSPFKTLTGNDSQGAFIGTGDQDNYIKVVLDAGGVSVIVETDGTPSATQYTLPAKPSGEFGIFFSINPATGIIQPKYTLEAGEITNLGDPITATGKLLEVIQGTEKALAFGMIGTSRGSGREFEASWDFFRGDYDTSTSTGEWVNITPLEEPVNGKRTDNEIPTKRHENAFVQVGDAFYFLGGRGEKPIEKYDLTTKTWSSTNTTLNDINHFQAVEYNGLIYIMGALTGEFPTETPVPNILIYDPISDKLITGPEIPEARRRGSAGAVVYNDKIYLVAGIINGHTDGWVAWLDEYDPATNTWAQMADAPRIRDHFFASVYNGEIFVAGGRKSVTINGNFDWSQTIGEVDVYNFANNTWRTLPNNIPTQRAGAPAAILGKELFVMGGESKSPNAHPQTEALDLTAYTWRSVADMLTPRHATQAIANNGGIYIMGGSNAQGGGANKELDSQDAFYLTGPKDPSGTAIAAGTLAANPDSLNFGTPEIGGTVAQTVTLTNEGGNQGMLIQELTIAGSADFSIVSPPVLPIFLKTGSSMDVEVQLAQTTAEMQTGTLTVTYSASATPLAIGLNNGDTTVVVPPDSTGTEPLYLINAGGPNYTDVDGKTWVADEYFTGGKTYKDAKIAIEGTDDDAIYQTERYGDATYEIPVENGVYDVNLHFAEIYHLVDGANKRKFDISIENGLRTLKDYDIFADGGPATAVIKEFKGIPIEDGFITIQIINTGQDNAKISAISIYPSTGEGLVIADIPNRSDVVGIEPELTVIATGGEGNLTFNATNLPDGLTIEPTNGMIEGIIAESALAKSPFNVNISVTDGNSTATKSFAWTIVSNIPGDTDGDGILDAKDAFAHDANNGNNTTFPVSLHFDNPSGVFVNGFSGMMLDPAGAQSFQEMYTAADITIDEGNSTLTINNIPGGDAVEKTNTQKNAFQFGIKAPTTPFIIHTRLDNPFKGKTPKKFQSAGLYIGNGDQDNYLKFVLGVNSATGLRVQGLMEQGGVIAEGDDKSVADTTLLASDFIDLLIHINPENKHAFPIYYVNGVPKDTLEAFTLPDAWLEGVMAVGIISTSTTGDAGKENPFSATWEFLDVKSPITSDTSEVVNAQCFGDVGSVTVTASGGIEPVTVTWPDGIDPENIPGGTHKVTISDANGYKVFRTIEIQQAAEIVLSITQTKQVTCTENGAVSLEVTGTDDYTATWTNEANESVEPGNLTAGTYFVNVKDNTSGCETTSQISLNLLDSDPVFENVPEDVTVACGETIPDAPKVMATDDCNGEIEATLEEVKESDRIVRTWTAVDSAGNEVMAMQIITLECPTGIDEDAEKDKLLKIYPNPSVNKIVNFEINLDKKDATMMIFNVVGKLMVEKKVSTSEIYTMDFHGYPSGNYMIKVFNEDNVVVKRFVLK